MSAGHNYVAGSPNRLLFFPIGSVLRESRNIASERLEIRERKSLDSRHPGRYNGFNATRLSVKSGASGAAVDVQSTVEAAVVCLKAMRLREGLGLYVGKAHLRHVPVLPNS